MSAPPSTPVRSRGRLIVPLVAVLVALATTVGLAVPHREAAAAPITAGGFTTSAGAVTLTRGATATVDVAVTSATTRSALVDVEVYDSAGRKVFQRYWDRQAFTADTRRTMSAGWAVPANQAVATYAVRVGIFSVGWGTLYHWNHVAGSVRVTAAASTTTTTTSTPATTTTTTMPATTTTTTAPATTTTTRPATTTTTTAPATTTTTTVPGGGGRFTTLPVGATLPSDAECASRVRDASEIRPQNQGFNTTTGRALSSASGLYRRVTGNFTGTTDEIIQWAACKWGIDEDIVRAQTAVESWWQQSAAGDFTTDPNRCVPGHPIGADGRPGQCPESIGVQQVRYPYWGFAFNEATTSTAHNLDVAMAARRNCFEGNEGWLNTVERGRDYAAGDLWGCVGLWFSGRWYTQPSLSYIAVVRGYYTQRIWETPGFRNG